MKFNKKVSNAWKDFPLIAPARYLSEEVVARIGTEATRNEKFSHLETKFPLIAPTRF